MSTVKTERLVDPVNLYGQRVRVHLNLHRGDWSICSPRNGNVMAYAPTVTLYDVTFKVSESMRQRVIANQRRKVHAWAFGELVTTEPIREHGAVLTYNPYRGPKFTVGGIEVDALPEMWVTFRDDRRGYVLERDHRPHYGHFSRLGGTWFCDTCNSPYCELA